MSHLSGENEELLLPLQVCSSVILRKSALNIKGKKAVLMKKSTTSFIRGNQNMEQKGNYC